MARGIERIEQDIASLEEVIQEIGRELQEAYANYLETLGKSVSKQLILAIYHLCTQGYPDNFLKLSLNQKQKLQQSIRKLGKRGDSELNDLLNVDEEEDEEDEEDEDIDENLDLEEISNEQILEITSDGNIKITADLPLTEAELAAAMESIAKASEDRSDEDSDEDKEEEEQDKLSSREESGDFPDSRSDEVALANTSITDKAMDLFAVAKTVASKYPPKSPTLDTSNPVELARWQQYLELSLQQVIRVVSRDANRILQRSSILPRKLPPSLLEAAAAASSEASAEIMPGPPNLLNLAIEIEPEQKSDSAHNLMKIMAVNLRLGEIEFADTELSGKRKRIRNISIKLAKAGREYQKIQRELSVAKAEATWRSSWYED